MHEKRFDPKKLERLNNSERYKDLPPDLIIEKAALEQPDVIIDLGAGTGFYSIPFAQRFPHSKIYACDISSVMIEWMKQNIVKKYNNIIPLTMNDSDVPLADGIADFLFTIHLHHELDNPVKTLEECRRLLKTGAKIVISDWKKTKTEHGPPLEIRCEPKEVEKHLTDAGFSNVEIYTELKNDFLITAEV
jgi:ubiquinone/menaquinone biosynthesis C-methylase UbiE